MRVNKRYGFMQECTQRYSRELWLQFQRVFDMLPIAATVGNALFCVHGGISVHLSDLSTIKNIEKPVKIPKSGMLYDLLWADPTEAVPEWIPSERGKTFSFGPMAAELFCAHSKVRLIVRGHQVVDDGYKFNSNGRVLTVFGVPWYKGSNHAALACFDEDGMGTIKQVEVVGNKCAPGKNANVLKLSKKSKAAFRGAVRTKRPFKCLEKQQGKPRKLFSRKDSIRHEDEWMTNSKEGMEKPTIDYDS